MNDAVVESVHRNLHIFLTEKFGHITSGDHRDVLAGGVALYTVTSWFKEHKTWDDELIQVLKDVYNALSRLRYDTENKLSVVRKDLVAGLCDIISPLYTSIVIQDLNEMGALGV